MCADHVICLLIQLRVADDLSGIVGAHTEVDEGVARYVARPSARLIREARKSKSQITRTRSAQHQEEHGRDIAIVPEYESDRYYCRRNV